MLAAEFETVIPEVERPKTYASDHTATGVSIES
jgi:hypothetical protein